MCSLEGVGGAKNSRMQGCRCGNRDLPHQPSQKGLWFSVPKVLACLERLSVMGGIATIREIWICLICPQQRARTQILFVTFAGGGLRLPL